VADRAEVLAYADRHGAKAAGLYYGLPAGTVRSWRSRARARAARQQPGESSPAEQWLEHARQIVAWASRGACLQCGGAGTVRVPEARRGGLVIQKARTIVCPTCGGPPRRIQVNELPPREWAEGMRVAGDAGLGWQADEWALIRAGEPNPDGRRLTGRPDPPDGGP
jgi:hypothetical protein